MVVQVNDVGMEIRAQELRIWNWVDYFGKKVIVNQIKKDNSKYYLWCIKKPHEIASIYQVIDAFEPIPLNEEILLKCGFLRTKVPMKSDIEYIDYRMGQFVLFILPKGIVEVEFCAAHNTIEERGYLREIKYLHQLQNLYFSLTGQELNVKL